MARTKQQLIDAINNSSLVQAVVDAKLVNTTGTLKTYDYQCLIGDENESLSTTITFYVNDEGGNNEEAWFKTGLESKITPETTPFRDSVVNAANNAVSNDVALTYKIDSSDEDSKIAKITAYIASNGNVTEAKYLAYNDKNDTLQFDELV